MDQVTEWLKVGGTAAVVLAVFKGTTVLLQTAGLLKVKTQRSIAEEYQQIVNMLQVQADRVTEKYEEVCRDREADRKKIRQLERDHDRCQNEQRAMKEALIRAGIHVGDPDPSGAKP